MGSRSGMVFGGFLAVVLLFLFSVCIVYLAYLTATCEAAACVPGKGHIYVVTTVGGLVSALVVAQLSVLKPGEVTKVANFVPETEVGQQRTNLVVAIYLAVWTFSGLVALIVGVVLYPDKNSTLADLGTGWLGMSVTAAYAYFGLEPNAPKRGRHDDQGPDRGLNQDPS